MWILTFVQLAYLIFSIVTSYGLGYIENGFVKLSRTVIESLMFLIFVIFLIFAYDPTNLRYMSPTTEGFQWTAFFLIMIMIGLEIALFIYLSFKAFGEKHKQNDYIVFEKDKNGVVKKTMTYKVESEEEESAIPTNKLQTYSRGGNRAKRETSPSANFVKDENKQDDEYTPPSKMDFDEGDDKLSRKASVKSGSRVHEVIVNDNNQNAVVSPDEN
jgi:magnesium-transporting ATPase (P-type)